MDKDNGEQLNRLKMMQKKAVQQLQLIDMQLHTLTTKHFHAEMEGSHGLILTLLTRRSVIEGVRWTFTKYIQDKEIQIQDLSALRIEETEGHITPESNYQGTSRSNNNLAPAAMLGSNDNLAPTAAKTFCLYSRGC